MPDTRFHDKGEQELPWEMWCQTVKNALRGRRGQAILAEMRRALLALPEKRLIAGHVVQNGEVCAVGALAAYRLQHGPLALSQTFLSRYCPQAASLAELEEQLADWLDDSETTADFGRELGMTRPVAIELAYQNDEAGWGRETPEERYRRVLRWVEEQLGLPGEAVGAD